MGSLYPEFPCKLNVEDLIKRTSTICNRFEVTVSTQTSILLAMFQSCQINLDPPLSLEIVTRLRHEALASDIGIKVEIPDEAPDEDLDPMNAVAVELKIKSEKKDWAMKQEMVEMQQLQDLQQDFKNWWCPDLDSEEENDDDDEDWEAGNIKIKKERKPKIKAQIKAEVLDYKEDEFGEQPLIGHDTEKYEERDFPCDHCDYAALHAHILRKHIRNCHSGYPFQCDQCESAFKRNSHLKDHKEAVHFKIKHPCDQCDMVYTTKSNLKKHKEIRHDGLIYYGNMKQEEGGEDGEEKKEDEKKFPCDFCDFTASKSSVLKKHKKYCHQGHKYHCDQCDFSFKRMSHLKEHREAIHDNIRYPCDQCDIVYTTKSNLKKHKQTKHKVLQYVCNLCSYRVTSEEKMEKHQKSEHGEKLEEYDLAASNGDLNGDVQQPPKKRFKTEVIDPTLEEDQRFLCDQCDYTAKRMAHLKDHREAVHENVRYPCDLCHMEYTTKSNLNEHKQIKHEDHVILCDQCDYKAKCQRHLKRHQKACHEEAVKFPCSQCDFMATRATGLQYHIDAKHTGIMYPCDMCDYKGSRRALKKHKKVKHKEVKPLLPPLSAALI